MVCKFQMSIYRLKQASRAWNICFNKTIKSSDFVQNVDEPCVYRKVDGENVLFLVLYVDDILLIGNDIRILSYIKVWYLVNSL
jgi:hypothetical protein